MNTSDFIEVLRKEISSDIEQRVIEKLTPIIEQRLYGNVFSVKEAAKYLGVSESTLRRMMADGEIKFFSVRGQHFFRQQVIDEWILKQEEQKTQKITS